MAKARKKIRVIYKRVGFDPVELTIDNTLEQLQHMVGGHIQTVMFYAYDMLLLCDEEGKLKQRPVNFPYAGDQICGSVLFCGINGKHFDDVPCSLSDFEMMFPWLFGGEA